MNRPCPSVQKVPAPPVEAEERLWIAVHPDGRWYTLYGGPPPTTMAWAGSPVTVLEYRLVSSAVYPLESPE